MEVLVLKIPEAAHLVGVSPRTYYAAVARGEVPAIRIGRRLVVPEAALRRFLDNTAQSNGLAETTP
jgi:excisionase family DNA binding protein